MRASPTQPPEIAIVEDAKDFAELEGEWEDLYHNSPLATPFQSWAWLYSWWEFYGEHYGLRLVTARDEEGLLVGIIPLMLERSRGLRKLLFIGTGPTDYLDVLARKGWEAEVAEAGVRALGQQVGPWQVADLHQLRPESAAWGIFERWGGPKTRVWQDNCPTIDVKPWDELLMSFKRKMRYDVRRAVRRAEADGLRCEPAGPEDAQRAAQRWMALHREAWRGREIAPEHLTRRFQSHLEVAVRRMTERELGRISEFRLDGEAIASHFLVFGRDFVGEHMVGSGEQALERYQISSLYIQDGINAALQKGSARLDLLRGEEPYKLRWASGVVANHRVVLGQGRIFWAPYAAYVALRLGAKRYVADAIPDHRVIRRQRPIGWIPYAAYTVLRSSAERYASSESAPRWAKGIVDRLK